MDDEKLERIVANSNRRKPTVMGNADVVAILQAISTMTENGEMTPTERLQGIRRAISFAIGKMEA